ncbi:hypothetical protein FKW77_007262 [Venturia effusa]|uniref:Uncharacterized protein n=1 Tax=Venturia effusa TaxID=50376 RepID=A0A517LN55_9PEZI|nr:hypothetical protein FKW77_007262 [Venturia effusa]
MDLSGELRNKIYRCCLVLEDRIDIDMGQLIDDVTMASREVEFDDGCNPWSDLGESEASSQLLRVSKEVFAETYTILYRENSFYVHNYATLDTLLKGFAPYAACVRDFIFRYGSSDYNKKIEASFVSGFQSLKHLRLLGTRLNPFRSLLFRAYMHRYHNCPPAFPRIEHLQLPQTLPDLSECFIKSVLDSKIIHVIPQV